MTGRCWQTDEEAATTRQLAANHNVTISPLQGPQVDVLASKLPGSWLLLAVCCMLLGFVMYPSLSLFAEANRQHIRRLFENGAPAAQVRWLMLVQAGILAVAASVTGVIVGSVGAAVVCAVAGTNPDGTPLLVFRMPWDVPVVCIVIVVLASCVAGLMVARSARSPKVFAPLSLVAAGLCSLAGVAFVFMLGTSSLWGFPSSPLLATLGTTALAPFVCVTVAWGFLLLLARAPWWLLRFAARTVQRRVVSFTMTVFAVGSLSLLSVAMGFMTPVSLTSHASYASDYPLAVGDAQVEPYNSEPPIDWEATLSAVQGALPQNDVRPVVSFARDRGTGSVGLVALAATPPTPNAPGLPASPANDEQDPALPVPLYFGTQGDGDSRTLVVLDGDRAQQVLGLSSGQRARFEAGAVVFIGQEHVAQDPAEGEFYVGLGEGTVSSKRVVEKATGVQWEQVPSLQVKPPLSVGTAAVIVPVGLAERFGVPTETVAGYVAAGRPLTTADRQAASQAVPEVMVYSAQPKVSSPLWPFLATAAVAALTVALALVLAMILMRRQLTADMVALSAIGGPPRSVGRVMGMVTVIVGITGSAIGVSMPAVAVSGLYLSSANVVEMLFGETASSTWSSIAAWAAVMAVFIPVPSLIAGGIVALTTRTPQVTARSG